MKVSFFACARFQMAIPGKVAGIDGGIIFPSGIPAHTLRKRNLEVQYPHLRRRLLDPQLYLATLNPGVSRKSCANLASYNWFLAKELEKYDSGKQSQADWRRKVAATIHRTWRGSPPSNKDEIDSSIRQVIVAQKELACEAIILPSPLSTDPNDDYSAETRWLDTGMNLAAELASDLPHLASIAISDTCLRWTNPWTNRFIDLVLDQVTARRPSGAYLVIELANERGYYCSHPNTVGALLRLVYGLREGGLGRVVVSFAGIAGLLALAVGADTWASGWYRGERRLKLVDLEDQIGMAVPTYYSHRLASELHLETDLDRVSVAGLLDRLADETPASSGLLRALRAGRSANTVPDWRYRRSNVNAAREHFLRVGIRETAKLNRLDQNGRIEYGVDWLKNAEALASDLYKVGSFNVRTELDHQSNWLAAYEKFKNTI